MIRFGGWFFYISEERQKLQADKCGKWMSFFDDQKFAQDICEKAITEHICYECKCSDMEIQQLPTGVMCFYLNGDDLENHKRVIEFMIANNLIRRTKTGRYYNISFKFDYQTRAKEYGADFEGEIKLSEFIDLNTGKWLQPESESKT